MSGNLQVHTEAEIRVRFKSAKFWPADTTFAIIEPQARREALEKLAELMLTGGWKIVGEPAIECVAVQRELLQST